eukprot:COSAG02_NODE_720_length_18054_cov_23.121192_8_plen_99_part_00
MRCAISSKTTVQRHRVVVVEGVMEERGARPREEDEEEVRDSLPPFFPFLSLPFLSRSESEGVHWAPSVGEEAAAAAVSAAAAGRPGEASSEQGGGACP